MATNMVGGVFGLNPDGTGSLLVDSRGIVVNGDWDVEYDPVLDRVRCPGRGEEPPSDWATRAPEGTPVPGYYDPPLAPPAHQQTVTERLIAQAERLHEMAQDFDVPELYSVRAQLLAIAHGIRPGLTVQMIKGVMNEVLDESGDMISADAFNEIADRLGGYHG